MSIVEERYSKWLNHENLAPQYKPVLEAMDAEEKNDAFYTTIEFGTAGMRGLLGPGTNRINIHTIRRQLKDTQTTLMKIMVVKQVLRLVTITVTCQKSLRLIVLTYWLKTTLSPMCLNHYVQLQN